MLKKFKEYLLQNPYWGVLHESAENQTYVPVDPSKLNGLSDNEKEILEIWNRLSRNMRREITTAAEASIENDAGDRKLADFDGFRVFTLSTRKWEALAGAAGGDMAAERREQDRIDQERRDRESREKHIIFLELFRESIRQNDCFTDEEKAELILARKSLVHQPKTRIESNVHLSAFPTYFVVAKTPTTLNLAGSIASADAGII